MDKIKSDIEISNNYIFKLHLYRHKLAVEKYQKNKRAINWKKEKTEA